MWLIGRAGGVSAPATDAQPATGGHAADSFAGPDLITTASPSGEHLEGKDSEQAAAPARRRPTGIVENEAAALANARGLPDLQFSLTGLELLLTVVTAHHSRLAIHRYRLAGHCSDVSLELVRRQWFNEHPASECSLSCCAGG